MKQIFQKAWNSPTLTTWGSFSARLLSVTLVLPMTLSRLDVAEVAVMQLFNSMIVLMLLLDFGVSPTLTRLFSYAMGGASRSELANMAAKRSTNTAKPDQDALNAVYATLRWLYMRLTFIICLLQLVLGTIALQVPIAQLADPNQGWLAWALILGSSLVTIWGTVYSTALQGANHIAPLRRWETLFATLQILSAFLVLQFGGKLLELVVANQMWAVVNVFRNKWLLNRVEPQLGKGQVTSHDPSILATLWPATWRSGVGILMSQGIVQVSGVVYSQFASAKEVAAYLLAIRFMTLVSQISGVPFYTKIPMLAQMQASGQKEAQINLAKKGMRLSYWVFVLGVVLIAFLVYPALSLIKSNVPFVSPSFWIVMSLAFFAERYGAMHVQLYSVTNHIIWHIANGVTGILMVACAIFLMPVVGNIALPFGMLFAYLGFYSWYCAKHSLGYIGQGFWLFERGVALAPAMVLIVFMLARYFLPADLGANIRMGLHD
jgi:hypothetical protein